MPSNIILSAKHAHTAPDQDRLVWVVQQALDPPPASSHVLLWLSALALAMILAAIAGVAIGQLLARLQRRT